MARSFDKHDEAIYTKIIIGGQYGVCNTIHSSAHSHFHLLPLVGLMLGQQKEKAGGGSLWSVGVSCYVEVFMSLLVMSLRLSVDIFENFAEKEH